MSQAEDLLRSIVEDSDEAHIVVGLDRKITVPAELKNIAVQYDTNVRTVTFDIPRHYDGRDLYAMTLFVYCHIPDGTVNSYPAEDVSIDAEDEEMLHFKWTITSAVTSLPGNIKISISAKSFDESGNVDKRWSSEINDDLVISPSYQSDDVLEEESPDTISQIYSKIDTVEKALSNHDHDARYYRKEVLDESLVAPDWDQNDETASDYIKNRPFYTESVSFENIFFDKDFYLPFAVIENPFPSNISFISLAEGETYLVTFNGTEYECMAYPTQEEGTYFIGNAVMASSVFEVEEIIGGNNAPFLFLANSDLNANALYLPNTETATISISKNGETLVDNASVAVIDEDGTDGFGTPVSDIFVLGETYNVVFDGVQYQFTASEWSKFDGAICIGNEDTCYPFFMVTANLEGQFSCMLSSKKGLHSIRITTNVSDIHIHEIDKKYLGYKEATTTIFDGSVYIGAPR